MSENYNETPQMSEGNFEDIKKLMKPMHWLAFEVIVSKGISEEKEAKRAIIKSLWRIISAL